VRGPAMQPARRAAIPITPTTDLMRAEYYTYFPV
jgi:hypothetical protein